MANAWSAALELLRRPAVPVPPPASKGAPRKFEATPSFDQAQSEVEAALALMVHERGKAESTIATAGARREQLLMQPESDEQILSLGSEIDKAQLLLERLDRVQPDLEYRLGEIKYHRRGARWIALRDQVAAKMDEFATAEAEYEAKRAEWRAVYDEVLGEFPTASEILPHLAPLRYYTETFAEQLENFRTRVIVLAGPARPMLASLADLIYAARLNGHVPDDCPPDWRDECERALRPFATVEMLVSFMDNAGEVHAKGASVQMTYDDAQRAVSAGRAIFVNDGAN